ncbi:MAPEG family protein [Synechococcales cyanobacterium C]|uniref:MAPEG family protein n=1 Tax=Petrachloros mirabilis ULC683 TaxID=2781853 RepID=A0A8K2A204_9CYAN|nr:MAPEG family protein [Petrachloros mirabilis ULC683]
MSPWPTLITLIALIFYFWASIQVGIARAKYKVPAPQTSGPPEFERTMRVHQNTLEQLVFFLPVLWIFSLYVDPRWGAGLGAGWILGRILYAWGYYQAAEKRGPGFAIASLSALVLLLGSLVGVIWQTFFIA